MRTLDGPSRPDISTEIPEVGATDYLHVRDYLKILSRRRWVVVAIVVVGLAAGVLQVWTTTPLFEAHATLQIDQDVNVLGVDRPLVPLDQRDWMREFLPTQLGILQSRQLARVAHDELTGSRDAGLHGSVPPIPSAVTSTSLPAGSAAAPSAAQIAAGRTVNLVRDTRLVNIGFRSTDPALSARVANALARAYLQQSLTVRSKTSDDASNWLSKQVIEQRARVDASEKALQQYRQENSADSLMRDQLGVEQQNVVVQKLAELQAAETKARTETFEKQAHYRQLLAAQASRAPLDTMPAITTNPYIQGLKVEVAALQRQVVQASQELGDLHP